MKRRTYERSKRILIRVSVAALILGAGYVYFRTGFFTIRTYTLSGVPENYEQELLRDIQLISEQKIYKVLPGNRVISYHDNEIRTLIMETLPNTDSISLRPNGLHGMSIKLTSHVPIFSVSDTHAISRNGTVYKEIISLADFPRLTIATSTEVTPEELSSLETMVESVDSVLFKVTYIDIDEHNDIRLFNNSKTSSVILSGNSDMNKAWSNIVSAIDTDPLKQKLIDTPDQLEYIDTRFGNKVFYKFTNGATPVIIPPQDLDDPTATSTPLQ